MTALLEHPRMAAPATAVEDACQLGFGCASLGSRVSAREGLRALEAAFDQGVTWFDVAPAYGAGQAETILGAFLNGKRHQVCVTTKVGLAAPKSNAALRWAYALGRPLAKAATGLRAAFRRMPGTRNRHLPLTPELVASSLERSLRALGADHVELFALHDPQPEDVLRDDIQRALEDALASGKARRIAVAGTPDACRAAARAGGPYGVLQTSVEGFAAEADLRAGPAQIVLHSVFGVAGRRERLLAALKRDPARRQRLNAAGYRGEPGAAVADLLLDGAFALNPGGIVLASMFSPGRVAANVARWRAPRFAGADAIIQALEAPQ